MKMEVEIISRECIKPSRPTPYNNRILKLSLLDQLIPAPYAPIVLFYPNPDASANVLQQRLLSLKRSLSEALTRYYPLAGRVGDHLTVDCNDHGAYYATANVNCALSRFLDRPDLEFVSRFLPCFDGTQVASFQVNVFECGGMAIGLCISHKIFDGASLGAFLNSWAATAAAASLEDLVYPEFIAGSLFPADDLWLRDSSIAMWSSLFKKGECCTKRFVFDASAIAALKAIATSSTKIEAVSAFLWKCMMEAANADESRSLLTHIVNLRKRAQPALSQHSVGNLIWLSSAKCGAKLQERDLPFLADRIRKSISTINADYIEKLRSNERFAVMGKTLGEIAEMGRGGANHYGFTSWCKLGFYDVDFGWGRPVWMSGIGEAKAAVYMNLIILMETRCGDGIEAWVTLDEKEMHVLETNEELLGLALRDPSPLRFAAEVLKNK